MFLGRTFEGMSACIKCISILNILTYVFRVYTKIINYVMTWIIFTFELKKTVFERLFSKSMLWHATFFCIYWHNFLRVTMEERKGKKLLHFGLFCEDISTAEGQSKTKNYLRT